MKGTIFLIQDDGRLVEMNEQPYDTEDLLQKLLADYPNLLAGDQMDSASPRRWLLVSREVAVPGEESSAGYVDHVFFDQDAILTLVEVKRSSDTRLRREVVAQMLDYAANAAVYLSIEAIRARFEQWCADLGCDPTQELTVSLGDELDYETFWDRAKVNLQAGKLRMVFVADVIPVELKRIVEFLNEQMDPAEVLAVEIKQYVGRDYIKALVPRVIGQTAEAEQKKPSPGRKWDEASFFQELEARQGVEVAVVARRILDWIRPPKSTGIWWGEGARSGSFVPWLNHKGMNYQLFAVWTYGAFEVYFQWYQYKPPFDSTEKRAALLEKLNAIEGVSLTADTITRRPSIRLDLFRDPIAFQQMIDAFEWVMTEIRAS